jgi:hypothetical protein
MMKTTNHTLIMLAAAFALSACSSMNVFKDSNSPSNAVPAPDAVVENPVDPITPTATSASQIKSLLSGKSWAWNGPKRSGVTLYASDGTSLVQVTGQGTTSGKWMAKDGQLCESFSPAKFIPQGVPMTCQTFTGAAGSYRVGQATFKLAS